jgi:hypothetical protein
MLYQEIAAWRGVNFGQARTARLGSRSTLHPKHVLGNKSGMRQAKTPWHTPEQVDTRYQALFLGSALVDSVGYADTLSFRPQRAYKHCDIVHAVREVRILAK